MPNPVLGFIRWRFSSDNQLSVFFMQVSELNAFLLDRTQYRSVFVFEHFEILLIHCVLAGVLVPLLDSSGGELFH